MDGWWMDADGVDGNMLKLDNYIIINILFITSHVLRMQTTAKY
jgi:hypothetical protein